MGVIVEVWGGDFQDRFLEEHELQDWESLPKFIQEKIDTGFMVVVRDTDFEAPNDVAQKHFENMLVDEVLDRWGNTA